MGLGTAVLMNISIKLYGSGRIVCRPDTTWERESRDFFAPGFLSRIWFSPVVFARISKAGKFISPKFAARYYDGLNFGILLYSGDLLAKGGPESLAAASVLDHSSILPFPLCRPEVFASGDGRFVFRKNGTVLYGADAGENLVAQIEKGICDGSEYVSQRIGDLMAIETDMPRELMGENEKRAEISAEFNGSRLFRLSIIK